MSDERNLKTAWVHHYGSTHGYDKAIERARQATLVEAAEWLDANCERMLQTWRDAQPDGTLPLGERAGFGYAIDLATQAIRTLPPQTPQGRAGTGHRATQSAPAGDWSSEDLKPLLTAHDGFVKVAAKMTMTTTEMAARNTKARKEAHDIDVAHAVALERAAIVSHLQRRQSKHYAEFDKWGDPSDQERGIAYDMAWQEVQNGAHHRRAGE